MTQPGLPLASIYSANATNSNTISAASWLGQQITFTFGSTPSSDVVAGSYISVSGASPSGYNSTLEDPWLVVSVTGSNVVVVALTNPGTYVSGGTVATSVLPNPTFSDSNGNFFFYAASGTYGVQIYGPTITERDLPDQPVGTLAGGSVTSVAMTGDGVIYDSAISGSPITTSGTFNLASSLLTESANYVLAGPTSGGAATPTFRKLVTADIPSSGGTVTSVGLSATVPSILSSSISGSPVTSSGTLALTLSLANENANTVFAGPSSGSASVPTFRALVIADIPLASSVYVQTTTINNSSISQGSNTAVMDLSVSIPSTGGPYRILASYTLYLSSSDSENGCDAWVTDGTNTWAFSEYFQNAGQNGSTIAMVCEQISPVTYAAGTGSVTITLEATDNHSGSTLTAEADALAGPGVSNLTVLVIASK